MARKIKFSKNSESKISSLCKDISNFLDLEDREYDSLYNKIYNFIFYDYKNIKDCKENDIVDFYIKELLKSFTDISLLEDKEYWTTLNNKVRTKLVKRYVPKKSYDDNVIRYYDDVKREYILHPMADSDNLEFCLENRDIFIKNNLKLVVDCAKRYVGLGLEYEDLIQAGNVGLLKAFDKFDSSRANLRFAITDDIEKSEKESFTFNDAARIVKDNFLYTKLLDQTLAKIPKTGFKTKQDFLDWTQKNIKAASFASIAFSWIRAQIVLELNSYCNILRIPKSVKDAGGVQFIFLDQENPHTHDTYSDNQTSDVTFDEFLTENDKLERAESQNELKIIVDKLLDILPVNDRRLVRKRFGINTPFALSLSELAENEGMSLSKVKQVITSSLKTLSENITEDQRDILVELFAN